MQHMLRQVFRSGKFVIGFAIFAAILLIVIIYPLFITTPPLLIIGQGTFFPPGIYVSSFDSITAPSTYILNLDDAATKRIASKLSPADRLSMKDWLVADGVPEGDIDTADTESLLGLWESRYDPQKSVAGMTFAKQRYYQRVNASIQGLLSTAGAIIAVKNPETGVLEESGMVKQSDYVNIGEVANVRLLPLGTDNFGRAILTELVSATGVSLQIGFVAGIIATLIGLILGLAAGISAGLRMT